MPIGAEIADRYGASRRETTANAMVGARFRGLADLLEIEGANPFRVRAYRRAASTVETLRQDVADLDLPAWRGPAALHRLQGA